MTYRDVLNKRIMSVEAIAQELRYHPTYVNKLIRDGRITGMKVNNHWYATIDEVDRFKKAHSKNKHYTLEEEAALILKKERSERKMKGTTDAPKVPKGVRVPWTKTEILNTEQTEDYLKTVRGAGRTGKFGDLTVSLAVELQTVRPGESKRFPVDDKKLAVHLQSYIRPASYLAGWYGEMTKPETDNWTSWESHVASGTANGLSPSLTVTRLTDLKRSKVVKRKIAEMEQLKQELNV